MKPSPSDPNRLERVKLCLDGLSLGDSFGEMFFSSPLSARESLQRNLLPPGPWWYTDDTEMALAIAEVLVLHGEINRDALAERFAHRYQIEPERGYGKGTRRFCEQILNGMSWRQAAAITFQNGSKGNGSAMRVAPVGAYFAEVACSIIAEEAKKSAEITHWHPEGIAGAIAVAVATALAFQQRNNSPSIAQKVIIQGVLENVPASETRDGILKAANMDFGTDAEHAAKILGNGTLVTCPDTVPYVIWSACRHLNDYTEAILNTLAGGGDTDTNCAMVGGIVAMFAGRGSIPQEWLGRREVLKIWDR